MVNPYLTHSETSDIYFYSHNTLTKGQGFGTKVSAMHERGRAYARLNFSRKPNDEAGFLPAFCLSA